MIVIDGSHGEGGGQIIRTSLTLSCLTQNPIKIINIRGNRENKGLRAQHVAAARSVRKVCRGRLSGDYVGSETLVFEPGKIVPGKYRFDIGTAGSTVLVAQTILPILAFADKKSSIQITGGTHVMKSPTYEYFKYVFIPAIHRIGLSGVETSLIKPGYYSKGNGILDIKVDPTKNAFVEVKDWTSYKREAHIQISGLPMHIAIREKKIFVQKDINSIYIDDKRADDIGNAVTYFDGFVGESMLGKKGKRAEDVAREVLDSVIGQSKFDVDMHLGDQLLVYGAMGARFAYTCRRTAHLETNADIIHSFGDEFVDKIRVLTRTDDKNTAVVRSIR